MVVGQGLRVGRKFTISFYLGLVELRIASLMT